MHGLRAREREAAQTAPRRTKRACPSPLLREDNEVFVFRPRPRAAALGCLPDSAAVLDRVGIPALGLGYTAVAGVPVAGAARSCVFAACCGGLSRRGVRMPGFGCEGYVCMLEFS